LLNKIAQPTPFENLSIVCPHVEMESLRSRLESRHKIYKLPDALSEQSQFDKVYIDTPPALNFNSLSALIASHKCLIPFDCDTFSKKALYALLGVISEVRIGHNPKLEVEGVIVNQSQNRANLPRQLVENLVEEGQPILNTRISTSVSVRESHSAAKSPIHFDARHKLSYEFRALYAEL
jgi:chromosome partitioning protein